MAKSKAGLRRGPGLLNKMITNLHRPQVTDDRLATLAVELGLAGGEVLRRDFGFTQEQTARWLDAMLTQAKVNRVSTLAKLAVEQIDNPSGGNEGYAIQQNKPA